MKRWLAPAVVAVVVTASAIATTIAAASQQSVELAITGRSNANPSMAALGTVVAVAWAATGATGPTDIYVAVSRDAGRTFGAPVRVAADASVSGEQPPRISLIPRS